MTKLRKLFSIISTKQQLDHAADQMVKQIQLSGGINSDTDELFDFLCSHTCANSFNMSMAGKAEFFPTVY